MAAQSGPQQKVMHGSYTAREERELFLDTGGLCQEPDMREMRDFFQRAGQMMKLLESFSHDCLAEVYARR